MENNNNNNENDNRNYQDAPNKTDFEKSELNDDPHQGVQPDEFIDTDPNRVSKDQNSKYQSDGELSNDNLDTNQDEKKDIDLEEDDYEDSEDDLDNEE